MSKKNLISVIALAMIFSTFACEKKDDVNEQDLTPEEKTEVVGKDDENQQNAIRDFENLQIKPIILSVGDTAQLKTTEIENVTFDVTSENSEIATAEVKNGKIFVSGVKIGETTLSVIAKKEGFEDKTITVKISVVEESVAFYINPNHASDGDGTEENPFKNFSTLNNRLSSIISKKMNVTVYIMNKIEINSNITIDGTNKNLTLCRYVNSEDDSKTPQTELIYVDSIGNLTLKNVTIDSKNVKCKSTNTGGCLNIKGNCTMNEGTLTGGYAAEGGAVYVDDNGVFTMNGGIITGNKADLTTGNWRWGGGVAISNSGKFIMNGGSITGNGAGRYGGGVFVKNGATFIISGDVKITDNKVGGKASNLHFQFLEKTMSNVKFENALNANSKIGVSLYGEGYNFAFTSGWAKSGNSKKEIFSADNDSYNVVEVDGELKLEKEM